MSRHNGPGIMLYDETTTPIPRSVHNSNPLPSTSSAYQARSLTSSGGSVMAERRNRNRSTNNIRSITSTESGDERRVLNESGGLMRSVTSIDSGRPNSFFPLTALSTDSIDESQMIYLPEPSLEHTPPSNHMPTIRNSIGTSGAYTSGGYTQSRNTPHRMHSNTNNNGSVKSSGGNPFLYPQSPLSGGDSNVQSNDGPQLHLNADPDMLHPDEERWGRFTFLRKLNNQIMICVFLGVLLGAILGNYLGKETSDKNVMKNTKLLVLLPGEIFLRVLKCFVIPMVFVSLSTGVAKIVLLGKASIVGTRTATYFVIFSTIAATIALIVAMGLKFLHDDTKRDRDMARLFFQVGCNAEVGDKVTQWGVEITSFLTVNESNSELVCVPTSVSPQEKATIFEIKDLEGEILKNHQVLTDTEQLKVILDSLFPANIFNSFQDGVLLSVITFSIAFGAAAVSATNKTANSPLLSMLEQTNKIFFYLMTKLMNYSPIAVLSLVAGSLMDQKSVKDVMTNTGVLALSNIVSVIIMEFIFYPIVLLIFTRRSPIRYMKQMIPCVVYAFGSSSSVATLPVTLRCVESTREVTRGLLHFVMTIGTSIHMNGTAMQFPNAIIFLAATSEYEISIGWIQLVLIVLVSVLSSIGVAPIPNAGLVMIYSVWNTIFPKEALPATFSYIVAIYWFLDRINTSCNVVGDTYVARILAEHVDERYEAALHENDA